MIKKVGSGLALNKSREFGFGGRRIGRSGAGERNEPPDVADRRLCTLAEENISVSNPLQGARVQDLKRESAVLKATSSNTIEHSGLLQLRNVDGAGPLKGAIGHQPEREVF